VGVLDGDRGVDAASVKLEIVELLGGKRGDGSVGGSAKLQGALNAVVLEEAGSDDLSEFAGGVATEEVHLEETVLRGDEALGDDEVVERGSADVGDAVSVTLNGDRSREARKGECAVDLGKRGDEAVVNVAAKGEEAGDAKDEEDGAGDGEELQEAARTASRLAVAVSRLPRE
jgi:hypothetical protein